MTRTQGFELGRLDSLDSLRGLAALTVVLHHVMWLYRPNIGLRQQPFGVQSGTGWTHIWSAIQSLPGTFILEASPLHLFAAGHEAVVLFFILSGFVLYLPWQANRAPSYRSFMVKRICRVYLPYLVSLLLVIFLDAKLAVGGGIAGMNNWFNNPWSTPIEWRSVVQHLVLLDEFDTDRFSPPIWSLVHEMRISLIFPAIALLVLNRRSLALPVAVILCVAGMFLSGPEAAASSYFRTLHYSAFFIAGCALAHYRERARSYYAELTGLEDTLFLLTAFVLYAYGRAVTWLPHVPDSAGDLLIGAGAAMIIVWAQSDPWVLRLRPTKWLGKVSFGLYLTHFGIIFACIYLWHEWLPLWLILCIAVAIALLVSEIFYRFVEQPSMMLGKGFSKVAMSNRTKQAEGVSSKP